VGKNKEKFEEKTRPQATHECPQKVSAHSVQPFGLL